MTTRIAITAITVLKITRTFVNNIKYNVNNNSAKAKIGDYNILVISFVRGNKLWYVIGSNF